MKVLYIHNSLPEYRYGYFEELNKLCELTMAFTDIKLDQKVYNTEISKDRLGIFKNTLFLHHNLKNDIAVLNSLIEKIKFDLIIVPALDDMYSILLTRNILKIAKKLNICTGLFWEKWLSPVNKQPMKRKIKEIVQFFLTDSIFKNLDILWSPGRKTDEYFSLHKVSMKKLHRIHDSSICSEQSIVNVREKYSIPKESKIILYLGRLVDYKGADILIKAFGEMKNSYLENNYLIIAGFGPKEQEYKELVDKQNIKNVIFTGMIEPEYRASFYKSCDIFVLPTKIYKGKNEAWGLTINEAMQFGKIVISTTAVASAYELINDFNGYLVHENNIDDLKNALEMSISTEIYKSAKIEDRKVISEYSYGKMAEDIIMGYRKIKDILFS